MKRRFSTFLVLTALIGGAGCSLLVSYDGYGDGARGDGGTEADGTISNDGSTNDSGGGEGGGDGSSDLDAGDAGTDALVDGGSDATTNKKYAIVVLGGEVLDGGTGFSNASVEVAMINADGTLGPWKMTTPMPNAEDETGAAVWGSSIFVMDDWGAAAAVMQPDGGLSQWASIANVGRNSPQMVAVDGRIYLAGGTNNAGGAEAAEVYYANITGPQTIGPWTATTPLSVVDGGPRNDTRLMVNDKRLYVVGGDHAGVDIDSILSAPINSNGTVGTWTENTPLPIIGDHVRTMFARGFLTMVGGSFDNAGDRETYAAPVLDGGALGVWGAGAQHPDRTEPTVVAHNNFVYLIGGTFGAADQTQTLFAPIDTSGFPGVWQTTTSLNFGRHSASAVVVEVP